MNTRDSAPMLYDVLIIGAGAAGLMAAAEAGRYGCKVLLLDHANEAGKKILISGGGRCNFTNIHTHHDRYISQNPHFVRSALSRYTPQDFVELVERYGIAWHEKTLGQLFCDGSARQIVDMLLEECRKASVELQLGYGIDGVDQVEGLYSIRVNGRVYTAPALVLATGGPSIPKMGATGFAYDVARQFGLAIVQPRPALVPFLLGGEDALFRSLSGVSAEVEVRFGKAKFREAALFTHRGLSGPAMLQISSYWDHKGSLAVNFVPDVREGWLLQEKSAKPRQALKRVIMQHLPERLVDALLEKLPNCAGELGALTDKVLRQAEGQMRAWALQPTGTEGYAKAEVTAGGISTANLSSRTMEASKVRGLYAIGEAVDVTGWLGGYNFQWAWASGMAAGQAIGQSLSARAIDKGWD